jgi:hypothetical protein
MIQSYSRSLTESETRRIKIELARIAKETSLLNRLKEAAQVLAAALVAGSAYSYFTSSHWYQSIIGAVILGVLLLVILWFESWSKNLSRVRNLSGALQKSNADIIRVTATAYSTFCEFEDLGVLYCFQIEPNKLFIIRGQEYYETDWFPCLDFELVNVVNAFCNVRSLSPKIPPTVTYSEKEMLEVASIEDNVTIEGQVDNALQALRNSLA